jgi:RNA polymerase sigma-70 factor (ECF subfamily)
VIGAARPTGRRPDRCEIATANELGSFAARVVAVLPHDQADVVLLRVLGGLEVDDVARVLHKQPGAVRALQQRALRRLARQVDPEPLSA